MARKYRWNVWVHSKTGEVSASEPRQIYTPHAGYQPAPDHNDWIEQEPKDFHDTLTFKCVTRGSQRTWATLTTSKGHEVEMFTSDLSNAIPHMISGKLTGNFGWVKHSSHLGVYFQGP